MVLCAPLLIDVAIFELAGLVMPELHLAEGAALDRNYVRQVTLIGSVAVCLHFGLVSVWSNWLGAGPFAGAMRTSWRWLVAAAIIGPAVLVVPSLIADVLMGGQEGWAFAEGYDRGWDAPENQSLATLFYVLILAPVTEEVTYRGVALGALVARGVGAAGAAVLSSSAFALIHLQYSPAALAVVFVAGLGFATLRLVSGTMIVPVVAHIAANGFVLAWPG